MKTHFFSFLVFFLLLKFISNSLYSSNKGDGFRNKNRFFDTFAPASPKDVIVRIF